MSQVAPAVAGLDIADLSVQLGGQTVLHNIELRAQHGEFVVLAGPSGSGKSTGFTGFTRSGSIDMEAPLSTISLTHFMPVQAPE